MPALFSSPSQNAASAANATASAQNAEIGNEEAYVNTSEQNLRNAIAAQGPNPYFSAPSTAGYKVDPNATASFSTAGPPGTMTGGDGNIFAAPPPSNIFAKPTRQAQPVMRAAPAQAQ